MITKVLIEIGDSLWEMDETQYKTYTSAETVLRQAQVARDKALGEPVRYPEGSCDFWITNVRLTKDGNDYIPVGTVGDLNVIEVGGRTIIRGLFYPVSRPSFGEVVRPEFERIR